MPDNPSLPSFPRCSPDLREDRRMPSSSQSASLSSLFVTIPRVGCCLSFQSLLSFSLALRIPALSSPTLTDRSAVRPLPRSSVLGFLFTSVLLICESVDPSSCLLLPASWCPDCSVFFVPRPKSETGPSRNFPPPHRCFIFFLFFSFTAEHH